MDPEKKTTNIFERTKKKTDKQQYREKNNQQPDNDRQGTIAQTDGKKKRKRERNEEKSIRIVGMQLSTKQIIMTLLFTRGRSNFPIHAHMTAHISNGHLQSSRDRDDRLHLQSWTD